MTKQLGTSHTRKRGEVRGSHLTKPPATAADRETIAKPEDERSTWPDQFERVQLERWVRAPTTPQRVVRRSCIVLMALDLIPDHLIAQRLAVSRPTIRLWTKRFAERGAVALLRDAPGRGRRRSVDLLTMTERLRQAGLLDKDGRPISIRKAAAALNVSASAVWHAFRPATTTARTRPKSQVHTA